MRLYSITVYRSSFFGGRRLPKLSKYITQFPLFAYVTQYVLDSSTLSWFTIPLSFWRTPSTGNVVYIPIKISLKYRMRIWFASYCSCTSVVTLLGIFNVSSFFFYARYLVRAWRERDKLRGLPWCEYDVAVLLADVAPHNTTLRYFSKFFMTYFKDVFQRTLKDILKLRRLDILPIG